MAAVLGLGFSQVGKVIGPVFNTGLNRREAILKDADQVGEARFFGLAQLHLVLEAANGGQLLANFGDLAGAYLLFHAAQALHLLFGMDATLVVLFEHGDDLVFELGKLGVDLGQARDLRRERAQPLFQLVDALRAALQLAVLDRHPLFQLGDAPRRLAPLIVDPLQPVAQLVQFLGRCVIVAAVFLGHCSLSCASISWQTL